MSCNCKEGNIYNIGMGCCRPSIMPADDFYTKPQIDEMIEEIKESGCCITEEEVDEKIESAKTEIEAEIPSLSGYATEEWVLDKHYISGVDLSDYALKSEIPTVPTSNTAFTNDAGYLTDHQSLSGYATEQWVLDQNYITGVDLSNYATKSEIPTVPTSNTAFTNDAGYLTEHQSLSAYSTTDEVNSAITQAVSGKQDTLTAGRGISIANNTVAFNLPIYLGGKSSSISITQPTGNTQYDNKSNGFSSTAIGAGLNAQNQYEVAVGVHNVERPQVQGVAFGGSGYTLFTVGNGCGSSSTQRHNALEIRQNGDIYISDTNASGTFCEKPMIKLQDHLGGGGSGVTSDEVQTMINNSLDDYVTKEELPTDIASKQWVINQNYASYAQLMQYITNLQNQIDALRQEVSGCCADTGTTLYRWVTMTGASDYTCSGTTKMTKEEEEQSTDGGNTWAATGNYRPGNTVLEPDCIDCGYTPEPSNLKYKGDYNTLQSKYVECDGVPSITVWEVQNDVPSTIDNLTGATFYACCEYIANNILGGANNIERVEIKEGVISVGGGAFQTSSALTTVIIPNSVKYIDGTAFGDCPNLSALTIGSGVTEIGEGAFSGDSSISNDLNLPNVTKINTAAFQGCSSLHSVNIGSGCTRIQGSAFRGCRGLTSITVNADVPPSLGSMAFDGSTCNIYVPAASLETYKTTYVWRDYADRIQAIP